MIATSEQRASEPVISQPASAGSLPRGPAQLGQTLRRAVALLLVAEGVAVMLWGRRFVRWQQRVAPPWYGCLLAPFLELPESLLQLTGGLQTLAGASLLGARTAQEAIEGKRAPAAGRPAQDSKAWVIDLYRKRARRYDFTANLYYLIGFREWAYRQEAVHALNLRPGDTVAEIGCGTGLNFSLLQEAVGPEGKVIGVDITDAMLEQARQRVAENGWSNVELVLSDAASFQFPTGVDGILSAFAMTLVPEYNQVIQNGCQALAPGGRWVVLDFRLPAGRVARLAPLLALLLRPFGVSMALATRHPWESMRRCLRSVSLIEQYGGFVYIAAGER